MVLKTWRWDVYFTLALIWLLQSYFTLTLIFLLQTYFTLAILFYSCFTLQLVIKSMVTLVEQLCWWFSRPDMTVSCINLTLHLLNYTSLVYSCNPTLHLLYFATSYQVYEAFANHLADQGENIDLTLAILLYTDINLTLANLKILLWFSLRVYTLFNLE